MRLDLPNASTSNSQEEETVDASQSTLVEYRTTCSDEGLGVAGQVFTSTPTQVITPIRGSLLNADSASIHDDIFQHLPLNNSFSLPTSPLYPHTQTQTQTQTQQLQQQQQKLISQQPFQQGNASTSFFMQASAAPLPPALPYQQQQQQQQQQYQQQFSPSNNGFPPQLQFAATGHQLSFSSIQMHPSEIALNQQQLQTSSTFPSYSPSLTSTFSAAAAAAAAAIAAPGFAPLTPRSFEQTFFSHGPISEIPISTDIGQPHQLQQLYQRQEGGPISSQFLLSHPAAQPALPSNNNNNSSSMRVSVPITAAATGASSSSNRRSRNGITLCTICSITETPSWRRHKLTGGIVCNACGLYYNLHGRDREFTTNSRGQTVVKRQPRGVSKRRKQEIIAQRQRQAAAATAAAAAQHTIVSQQQVSADADTHQMNLAEFSKPQSEQHQQQQYEHQQHQQQQSSDSNENQNSFNSGFSSFNY